MELLSELFPPCRLLFAFPFEGSVLRGILPSIFGVFVARGGGLLYIFWVRGRAIGKGIDFHDFGIMNGIDFHDFGIRNGIDFRNFRNWYRVVYAFSENWYKVRYIF